MLISTRQAIKTKGMEVKLEVAFMIGTTFTGMHWLLLAPLSHLESLRIVLWLVSGV
jgi:Ca2+/Na+ antiporter